MGTLNRSRKMFEQDYIMRLIKEMVRTLLKMLFHIDTESPIEEMLEDREEKYVLERLLKLVDKGKINEAENQLIEILNNDMQKLIMALLFYAYLNEKTDDFLLEHDFSREEIKSGIEDAAARYGIANVSEIFLDNI